VKFLPLMPDCARATWESTDTCVVCIPNHDPSVVAADAAQLDHMSRGSFMVGIGPG